MKPVYVLMVWNPNVELTDAKLSDADGRSGIGGEGIVPDAHPVTVVTPAYADATFALTENPVNGFTVPSDASDDDPSSNHVCPTSAIDGPGHDRAHATPAVVFTRVMPFVVNVSIGDTYRCEYRPVIVNEFHVALAEHDSTPTP